MLTNAVKCGSYAGFTGHTQERNVCVVAFGVEITFDAFALVPVGINRLAFGEILNCQKLAGTEVGSVDLTAFINYAERVAGSNTLVHVHRRAESLFNLSQNIGRNICRNGCALQRSLNYCGRGNREGIDLAL